MDTPTSTNPIPYASYTKSAFTLFPDGKVAMAAQSPNDYEDNAYFGRIRPLALEAFETSLDGWLTYEQIWDYVKTKMFSCNQLHLIDLLNKDKQHFTKVTRFEQSHGTIIATFRKTRTMVPVVKLLTWNMTLEEALAAGCITKGMHDMIKEREITLPYSPTIKKDLQGRQFVHPKEARMMDFLKNHMLIFKANGAAEYRGFEVKMEESAEPSEPVDLEKRVNLFKSILAPVLETPHNYLDIVQYLTNIFILSSTDDIRTVLKYTLTAFHRFVKVGRHSLHGDIFKTLTPFIPITTKKSNDSNNAKTAKKHASRKRSMEPDGTEVFEKKMMSPSMAPSTSSETTAEEVRPRGKRYLVTSVARPEGRMFLVCENASHTRNSIQDCNADSRKKEYARKQDTPALQKAVTSDTPDVITIYDED